MQIGEIRTINNFLSQVYHLSLIIFYCRQVRLAMAIFSNHQKKNYSLVHLESLLRAKNLNVCLPGWTEWCNSNIELGCAPGSFTQFGFASQFYRSASILKKVCTS